MLNNHQKSYLRAMGNRLSATVAVGREGISESLLDSLENSLNAHELVKVTVQKSCPFPMGEVKIELAADTRSEIVQVIGRSLLLYRRNPRSPVLELPK